MSFNRLHGLRMSGSAVLLLLSMCLLCAVNAYADAADVKKDVQVENEEKKALLGDFDIALATHLSGDAQGAIQLWQEILVRASAASTPLANIALLQMQLGNLELAEQSLKDAITRHPTAAYYNQLGVIQRRSGKFSEARKSYQEALSLDESYAKAHLNLGILCDLYLDDTETALFHYRRYMDISTEDNKEINNWIADLEHRLKVQK